MEENTVLHPQAPAPIEDALTDVLRRGARTLLAQAVQEEVDAFVGEHAHLRDENGRARIVRNGYLPEREVQTGVGPVSVTAPRVRDRAGASEEPIRFSSKVLPRYLRRSRSLEELVPWLYLKGVSTGDFKDALAALLGRDAPGLSPSTIARLKDVWRGEHEAWRTRDLTGKAYVYVWVDGVHLQARLEESKHCILVVMGATREGTKELIAIGDGYQESEQAWLELLLDLRRRGLTISPKLAIGDGALGFWKALPQVYGDTRQQRCWVHKTQNVLAKLPKSQQAKAKSAIQDIWMAATKADADAAFQQFIRAYEDKYPRAADCLAKDKDDLLAFYDFPAQHWQHIRTTNPIESTFATVRLRTQKTRNTYSRPAMLSLVFKLCQAAETRWLKLRGYKLLTDVIQGIKFKDGIPEHARAA